MCAQLTHGAETLGVLVMFHEPTRRLWTEENANHEKEGGDEGRAKLQTPSDVASVLDDNIGGKSEENTCNGGK